MARINNPRKKRYLEAEYFASETDSIGFRGNFITKNSEDYFSWLYDRINQRGGEFICSYGRPIEDLGGTKKKGFEFRIKGYLNTIEFKIEGRISKELLKLLKTKKVSGRDYSDVVINFSSPTVKRLDDSKLLYFLGLERSALIDFFKENRAR